MIKYTLTMNNSCTRLSDVPPGAEITEVNGREVLGSCEVCGWPVIKGQKHKYYVDGEMVHSKCPKRTVRYWPTPTYTGR